MEQPTEGHEEPPIAKLFGAKKRGKKKRADSPPETKTGGTAKKKEGVLVSVDVATENATGCAEGCANGSRVTVSTFDHSVENHFRAMDTISQLSGEGEDDGLEESEIQRFSSSITFLREWKYFCYEPKIFRFACEVGSLEGRDDKGGINLSQFSSATVPKKEGPYGGATFVKSRSCCSKDFVMYVGGHVWSLDWCPRVHQRPESQIKCEFIAVAAHPPGSSYHKIGVPLTGRGVVQIWCLLNVGMDEDEVPPPTEKVKRVTKNSGALEDESTLSKRPRGRPREKPIEDSGAITTQSKWRRGRPRKNPIEKPLDNSECNDQSVQALTIQIPEYLSELIAIDGAPEDAQEHAVQEDNSKKQKRYKRAAWNSNPELQTPMQSRRLKNKKKASSYIHDASPLLLTQNEDTQSSVMGQIQHNPVEEPAVCDNLSHNDAVGISSSCCLISNEVALPRVVLCLAHNGKVAWDVKWRPSNAYNANCKHRMGYLAVLLGNGSLEVWEVPLPRMVRAVYSSAHL